MSEIEHLQKLGRSVKTGLLVWFGALMVNVNALMLYAEIKHDNWASATCLVIMFPIAMGLIGAEISSAGRR